MTAATHCHLDPSAPRGGAPQQRQWRLNRAAQPSASASRRSRIAEGSPASQLCGDRAGRGHKGGCREDAPLDSAQGSMSGLRGGQAWLSNPRCPLKRGRPRDNVPDRGVACTMAVPLGAPSRLHGAIRNLVGRGQEAGPGIQPGPRAAGEKRLLTSGHNPLVGFTSVVSATSAGATAVSGIVAAERVRA